MTHPLVTMLDSIAREEAAMTKLSDSEIETLRAKSRNVADVAKAMFAADERNDRREGYCDGSAGKWQEGRSHAYTEAQQDGAFDRAMLAMHYEMKRRAALPESQQ